MHRHTVHTNALYVYMYTHMSIHILTLIHNMNTHRFTCLTCQTADVVGVCCITGQEVCVWGGEGGGECADIEEY